MDYLYLIPSAIVLFSIPLFTFYFLKNQKKFKTWEEERKRLAHGVNRDIYPCLEDMEEKMKNLEVDINQIHAHLIKLHQDQISWLCAKKELPEPAQMMLLLDHHKKEYHGYLNRDKESWTITSLGNPMKKVSLEKVSHWKPIFHL